MDILHLPEDIMIQIFGYLNFKALINCSKTCHIFYTIIRNSSRLKYNNELEIAGLVDTGSASSCSIADRLEQLEVIERNWGTLNFRSKVVIPKMDTNIWELFGGVFSLGTSGGRGLSFTELPSLTRKAPTRTWKHNDLGVEIRDFGMDPSQDLAVLIESPKGPHAYQGVYSIHLRSMLTGSHHPCATEPIITCTPQSPQPEVGGAPSYSFVIQIMGDFLGVLFELPIGEEMESGVVYVWNWKTGQTAMRMESLDDIPIRLDSFSFLSPRHILVSRHLPLRYADFAPTLEIYDFVSPESIENPEPVRIFEFPELNHNAVVLCALTRSDPSPEKFGHVAAQSGRPFMTAPTARLLTVYVKIFRDVRGIIEINDLMLFVHHDSLLDGIDSPGPTIIPWEEWGPTKTRLLRTDHHTSWVCYVHGTRYVKMERGTTLAGEKARIRLLDFNPLSVYRDVKLSGGESSIVTVFQTSEPTVIDQDENIFAATVTTSLPYREVLSAKEYRYMAVMINDDCLVGFHQGLTPDDQSLEFLCV